MPRESFVVQWFVFLSMLCCFTRTENIKERFYRKKRKKNKTKSPKNKGNLGKLVTFRLH